MELDFVFQSNVVEDVFNLLFVFGKRAVISWSPKGERIKIFPQRDKKINLFGVFRPDNFCLTYESAENINSDFLIRSISDFCQYLEKPTVLVLDNAPTHRSEKFLAAVDGWKKTYTSFSCRNIHRI